MAMVQTVAIERVAHTGIRVRDLDRALAFYRVLGFRLSRRAEGDDVAIIRNPQGVEINLIFNANAGDPATNILMDVPEKYPGYTHVALSVASIPATIAALKANEIAITQGPVKFGEDGHITPEGNASEPERSHVRPQAAEPTGPHREGEEPKPMMHGHEKSDSAIVATKPPNKAGRPVAEAVERRAEAKENANRCRTCRTQCRESVSPTPERVRKAEASRQTSEVGAVCRKAARTVLCGGRPVMGVPCTQSRE